MTDGPAGQTRGDAASRRRFDDLYTQTYPALMAYAVRRCVSRADAEDLVAEAFMVAWRRLDDVPDGDAARAWLFGTARLIRMAQFRRRSRRRRLLNRLWSMRPPVSTAGPTGDQDPTVKAAFDRLKDTDRDVLALSLWEGLTAREIGQVLDISEPAVWKRLERARSRLRAHLDQPEPVDPEPARDGSTTPTTSTVRSTT